MELIKPTPLGASKIAVSDFAEEVAKQLNYQVGEDMWPFISRIGGRISYNDNVQPSSEQPESIIVAASGEFQIFLPTVTTQERDRFTIAHELGHLFLHFPKINQEFPGQSMAATRWIDSSNPEQQRAEWEANWFAAAFLMPADQFREVYQSNSSRAAAHFGVSQSAIEVRAKTLGI